MKTLLLLRFEDTATNKLVMIMQDNILDLIEVVSRKNIGRPDFKTIRPFITPAPKKIAMH
ncbi:MAG: hypothetical protein GDA68_05450 [Nitrospira sp. CR2.1]|nr:hypothetical protein [Nitrospira sp. CR2.1]